VTAGKRAAAFGLVLLSFLAAGASAPGAAAPSGACERPKLGFLGPITGPAAFIGKEQLGFARYAIRRLADRRIKLVESDTQLEPAKAARAGAKLHADPDVLAVVGPAGSQEVLAVAPVFTRAPRLPFVSGSAIQAALTNGSIPSFFRVVPSDRVQAQTVATFIQRTLQAERVVVVDDRTAYSRPLATRVQARLRTGGVGVTRSSVSQSTTDFSSLVARIGDDVDVVFLPWQVAASAESFARQLRQQGGEAVIVGADTLDSGDFAIPGAYVTSFAPDVRAIEGNAAFVEGYGARFVSNFGPPAYVAAQAAIAAIRKACADGRATRAEVQRHLRATVIPRIVLGGSLRFTARGDRKDARFFVFRIGADGKKTMVGGR
jgi:branched-chain amino acid transport system substrate-binding protein